MKLKLEIVVSVTAMITAVAAVVVAILQTQVMHDEAQMEREHARLSVLPSVFVYTGSHVGDAEGSFWIGAVNQGIGPASIEGMTVSIDGDVKKTWAQMVATGTDEQVFIGGSNRNVDSVAFTDIDPGVLLPADARVEAIKLEGMPEIATILRDVLSNRVEVSVCYCSLYRDCWTVNNVRTRPEPVKSCKAHEEAFFRNGE